MPRRNPVIPPDPWQIVERQDGWWLQERQPSGVWADVGGPYVQRWGAVLWLRRHGHYPSADGSATSAGPDRSAAAPSC